MARNESFFNSKDALRLVERRAIDYLNIKLMKCGGIREALKINAICEAAGIEVMLGCMVEESNLGITAAASLGAATRNITRADLDATFNMTERPFKAFMWKTRRNWCFRMFRALDLLVLITNS